MHMRSPAVNRGCYASSLGASCTPHARHLGGRFSWNGSNHAELAVRLLSAKRGWFSMGQFWTSDSPASLRRVVFLIKVQAPGISAAETYLYRDSDYRALDKLCVKFLRVMLKGEACDWGGLHPRAWSPRQVLRYWRVAPAAVEVRTRRLRWLQDMVAHRPTHGQVVAALFGKLPDEEEATILPTGRLSEGANSFARRLLDDLNSLAEVSSFESFSEAWADSGGNFAELFAEGSDLHELFLVQDFAAYRASSWLGPPTRGEGP